MSLSNAVLGSSVANGSGGAICSESNEYRSSSSNASGTVGFDAVTLEVANVGVGLSARVFDEHPAVVVHATTANPIVKVRVNADSMPNNLSPRSLKFYGPRLLGIRVSVTWHAVHWWDERG